MELINLHKRIVSVIFTILILFLFGDQCTSQTRIKIATYNLLNYPGSDASARNPYFRTVINSIDPDILVVNEINTQSGVNSFLANVLNHDSAKYSSGTYINGYDSDNAIFYKSSKINFISNTSIQTSLRDINEFKITNKLNSDTLRIYSVHLKAGSSDSLQRASEIDVLRQSTDLLNEESNFIVLGDFNIYSANESAYKKLLQVNPNSYGNFFDPLNMTGIWNNSAYAIHHTQSTRVRSFGNGATGGLDDRFDMILFSESVQNPGGIKFIPGTYLAFGNDGNHYNDSINQIPNTAVSFATANALHYASDHLPVCADFEFANTSFVNIKVIPEGLYNPESNKLNRSDTVRLYLRNYIAPYNVKDSSVGIQDSLNFSTLFKLKNTQPDYYFIEIKTANTIETWSESFVQFYQDSILYYDFTTSAGQAFGDNQILKGNKYCIYSGDVNDDGNINLIDVLKISNESNVFTSGYNNKDLNGDNLVDLPDMLISYNNSVNFISKIIP